MGNDTRRNVGTIVERGGRYLARIEVGVRADGSRRTMSKTFATKSDAEVWLIERAVEMGKRPDVGAGITLKTLWPAFERAREGQISKRTMKDYRYAHAKWWLERIGDVDVTLITPAVVQRELDTMTHDNAKHAKAALSAVLTWATRAGIIQENPIRGHSFEFPEKSQSVDIDDDDPFAAIEEKRIVWDMDTVLRCLDLIRGLPLEPAWLACVGAGLRVEEAMALRPVDVRRTTMAGVEVTQLAVHHASTAVEKRKGTKTKGSVRIVTMLEPFGARFWELVQMVDDRKSPVCKISASRQNKAWRTYFLPRSIAKHAPRATQYRGTLEELPYVPLSKMRNTHATLMAEAGVLDSINAAMHGHSERIASKHYIKPDTTSATIDASKRLKLVM